MYTTVTVDANNFLLTNNVLNPIECNLFHMNYTHFDTFALLTMNVEWNEYD